MNIHPCSPVSTLTLVLIEGAFCQAWSAPAAAWLPVTRVTRRSSKVHFPPLCLSLGFLFPHSQLRSNHLRMSWGRWIIIHTESLQTLAWLTLPVAAILQITLADLGAKALTRATVAGIPLHFFQSDLNHVSFFLDLGETESCGPCFSNWRWNSLFTVTSLQQWLHCYRAPAASALKIGNY